MKMVQGNLQSFSGIVPGEQIITLNSNVHLIYSNQNTEGQIVAETNWSFQGMCAIPGQKLIGNDNNYNILNDSSNWVESCDEINGVSIDNRWRLLDTYN